MRAVAVDRHAGLRQVLDIPDRRAQGRAMSLALPFVTALRAATAADHAMVDGRFGTLRLENPVDYRRMLRAHARALPAVEAALATEGEGADGRLPAWQRRTPALLTDLAGLGIDPPAPLAFAADSGAARWGALYVAEGSRLGGQLLARAVPVGQPHAYLSARHRPGEWRALLAALEQQAAQADASWQASAIAGARATFALYAQSAAIELGAVELGAVEAPPPITHSGD